MKSKLREVIKTILRDIFGIQVLRIKKTSEENSEPKIKMNYVHDPAFSYMKSPVYKDMLIEELAVYGNQFFSNNYFSSDSPPDLTALINDFFELYENRNLTDNTHGSGFHNSFWLYLFARVFNPDLIVESGVWKAHTTWLLEQACPSSTIYGFDIKLKHVEYTNLKSTLIEKDWSSFQFPKFDPAKAFVFFDCHINNAQRLLEAKDKGFKHVLIDDNPPVHKLFSFIPGIPTASMLFTGQGLENPNISWVWNNKEISSLIDLDEAKKAKDLIKIHHVFPDVGGPTRYGNFSYLTYVQI